MKVLIVEDSPRARRDLEIITRSLGGEDIISTSYEEEAEEICNRYDVGIIVMDMNFPIKKGGNAELTGFRMLNNIAEICRQRKKSFPSVIIYSGYEVSEEKKKEQLNDAVPKEKIVQEVFPWTLRSRLAELIKKT